MNNRIKWYVAHQHEVLSHGDLFLAKIDVGALSIMRKARKEQWLRHLDKAQEICEQERRQTGSGQNLITQYFRPRTSEEFAATDQRELVVDPR